MDAAAADGALVLGIMRGGGGDGGDGGDDHD